MFAGGSILHAQAANPNSDKRPSRIVSAKNRYSVMFPRGWLVWELGDDPVFYNFRPQDSIQGQLPEGGASILMLENPELSGRQQTLSVWANQLVKSNSGANEEVRDLRNSLVKGAAQTVQLSFEQPELRIGELPTRFVVILWELKGKLFGAELSFYKGDPKAPAHERVLLDIVRSFRLP